ncbi:MAG: aminopeptidase [Candidatus Zixiibacteriota bacterium]
MDQRLHMLARVLVNYSLGIKPGHLMKIQAEPIAAPLIAAVYEEALRQGAHIFTEAVYIDLRESLLRYGSDEQLMYYSPMKQLEVEKIDAMLSIWGTTNTKFLSGVDPARQQLLSKAGRPYVERFFARQAEGTLHWCGTQFPTEAHAQDAEMSLREYEDFVFRAGHLHEDDPVAYWRSVETEQDRLVKILNSVDSLHLRAEQTDLKLRVQNRKWINCCGKENFPDGEIFTSPIEDSVNGTIRYSFPAFYGGREVPGVRLTFKEGVITEARAEKYDDFLQSMLGTDEGARRLGEFAIGTNYEIKKFTRNTLFDEKIGGTCHLAIGASFPEAGGKNKSAIHWDMVCDLNNGGEIEADGKVIYRNGVFTI